MNTRSMRGESDEGGEERASHPEAAETGATRRRFLKAGLVGIGLLPYVAPLVQSIALSDVEAQGWNPFLPQDDDKDKDRRGKKQEKTSPPGRRRGGRFGEESN